MPAQRKSSHRFTPKVLQEVLARVAENPAPLTLYVSDGFSDTTRRAGAAPALGTQPARSSRHAPTTRHIGPRV